MNTAQSQKPWHDVVMYTDHRYKTPDTATLESGCLLFGPHTIHYREQHVVTQYL